MPGWWIFINTLIGILVLGVVVIQYARLRKQMTDLEIKLDRTKYEQCRLQDELKETKARQGDSRIIHPEIVTHTVKTSTTTTTEQPKEG